MKEFYSHINQKYYYILIFIFIALMTLGLFINNPHFGHLELGFILHSSLVFVLSTCLIIYPKYEKRVLRIIIILVASAYFYTIFLLFPNTWTTFIFICLIPTISIFFFDQELFYFSFILNGIAITIFCYILLNEHGSVSHLMKKDLIGNIFNFLGSQVIIYLIYYLSNVRIQKQLSYYEQVQQAERLKTTGQLAAAVAHEIRNPLTVVKGFLQIYEQDTSLHNEVKNHFRLMIDELNSAEHVISHFLSTAKPDTEKKLDTVNVKTALQSVTDIIRSYGLLHDSEIDLQFQENCYIAINLIEFKQLMINLIKNAIEASSNGDKVSVIAERMKDFVYIKIIDNGSGMSEAEIKALGTPFYSLKSKGTGLGLMICFNIVEKYNGTIHFQSIKSEGTTVNIRFPIAYY